MMLEPYPLVDDIGTLCNEILGRSQFSQNMLSVSRKKALATFAAFVECYDLSQPEIAHKHSHTLRVAINADEIATRASQGESLYASGMSQRNPVDATWLPDGGACFLMGLLHDLGRFPQYAMYRTYSDTDSFPHADMSYDMLTKFKMISQFVEIAEDNHACRILRDRMLRSIRVHSLLRLGAVTGGERAYYDILRDADKIDILEAYCHAISSPGFVGLVEDTQRAMSIGDRNSDVPPADVPFVNAMARMEHMGFSVSDDVIADVAKRQPVDRRNIVTAGDAVISNISLYAGVETSIAKDMIAERGTMRVIGESVIETYGERDATGRFETLVRLLIGI